MTATKPILQLPVGDLTYTAKEMRLMMGAVFGRDLTGLAARSGVVGQASLKVHQTGSASQSVVIDAGVGVIQGSGATQGQYVCPNDAAVTLAMAAAHASLTRIDIVYARVLDDVDGVAGGSTWAIEKLEGVAGGSEPALPVADAIKLAAITRAAAPGGNTITDGNISDRRASVAAQGGVIVCNTVADIVNPEPGQMAWETSTQVMQRYSGTAWRDIRGGTIHRLARSSLTANSASVTAETQVQTISANLVSGRIYQVSWHPEVFSSVAGDVSRLRIRENNVAGTILATKEPGQYAANRRVTASVIAEYTAVSTASKTFSLTVAQALGSGTHTIAAAATAPAWAFIDEVS